MFAEEFQLAKSDKKFWLYWIAPTLMAIIIAIQYFQIANGSSLDETTSESFYTLAIAVATFFYGLAALAYGSIWGAKRFQNLGNCVNFWNIMLAAIANTMFFIIPAYIIFPIVLALGTHNSPIPEWSLTGSCVARTLVFTASFVAAGIALSAALRKAIWGIVIPPIVLVVIYLFVSIAIYVQPYLILLNPAINYVVWISGYRYTLVASWQAGVFWLCYFALFIGGGYLAMRRKNQSSIRQ